MPAGQWRRHDALPPAFVLNSSHFLRPATVSLVYSLSRRPAPVLQHIPTQGIRLCPPHAFLAGQLDGVGDRDNLLHFVALDGPDGRQSTEKAPCRRGLRSL